MAKKKTKSGRTGPAKEDSCTASGGENGVKGEDDASGKVADEQHAQMPKGITTATRSDAKPRAATGGPTGDSGCADRADGHVSAAHRRAASEAFVKAGYELTALHSMLVRLEPESPHARQILERIFQVEMSRLTEDGTRYMGTLSVSAAAPVTVTEKSPLGQTPSGIYPAGTAAVTPGTSTSASAPADVGRTTEKAVSQMGEDSARSTETASDSAAAPVTVTEKSPLGQTPSGGYPAGTAAVTPGTSTVESAPADVGRTTEKAVSQLDEDGARCMGTASFIASASGIGMENDPPGQTPSGVHPAGAAAVSPGTSTLGSAPADVGRTAEKAGGQVCEDATRGAGAAATDVESMGTRTTMTTAAGDTPGNSAPPVITPTRTTHVGAAGSDPRRRSVPMAGGGVEPREILTPSPEIHMDPPGHGGLWRNSELAGATHPADTTGADDPTTAAAPATGGAAIDNEHPSLRGPSAQPMAIEETGKIAVSGSRAVPSSHDSASPTPDERPATPASVAPPSATTPNASTTSAGDNMDVCEGAEPAGTMATSQGAKTRNELLKVTRLAPDFHQALGLIHFTASPPRTTEPPESAAALWEQGEPKARQWATIISGRSGKAAALARVRATLGIAKDHVRFMLAKHANLRNMPCLDENTQRLVRLTTGLIASLDKRQNTTRKKTSATVQYLLATRFWSADRADCIPPRLCRSKPAAAVSKLLSKVVYTITLAHELRKKLERVERLTEEVSLAEAQWVSMHGGLPEAATFGAPAAQGPPTVGESVAPAQPGPHATPTVGAELDAQAEEWPGMGAATEASIRELRREIRELREQEATGTPRPPCEAPTPSGSTAEPFGAPPPPSPSEIAALQRVSPADPRVPVVGTSKATTEPETHVALGTSTEQPAGPSPAEHDAYATACAATAEEARVLASANRVMAEELRANGFATHFTSGAGNNCLYRNIICRARRDHCWLTAVLHGDDRVAVLAAALNGASEPGFVNAFGSEAEREAMPGILTSEVRRQFSCVDQPSRPYADVCLAIAAVADPTFVAGYGSVVVLKAGSDGRLLEPVTYPVKDGKALYMLHHAGHFTALSLHDDRDTPAPASPAESSNPAVDVKAGRNGASEPWQSGGNPYDSGMNGVMVAAIQGDPAATDNGPPAPGPHAGASPPDGGRDTAGAPSNGAPVAGAYGSGYGARGSQDVRGQQPPEAAPGVFVPQPPAPAPVDVAQLERVVEQLVSSALETTTRHNELQANVGDMTAMLRDLMDDRRSGAAEARGGQYGRPADGDRSASEHQSAGVGPSGYHPTGASAYDGQASTQQAGAWFNARHNDGRSPPSPARSPHPAPAAGGLGGGMPPTWDPQPPDYYEGRRHSRSQSAGGPQVKRLSYRDLTAALDSGRSAPDPLLSPTDQDQSVMQLKGNELGREALHQVALALSLDLDYSWFGSGADSEFRLATLREQMRDHPVPTAQATMQWTSDYLAKKATEAGLVGSHSHNAITAVKNSLFMELRNVETTSQLRAWVHAQCYSIIKALVHPLREVAAHLAKIDLTCRLQLHVVDGSARAIPNHRRCQVAMFLSALTRGTHLLQCLRNDTFNPSTPAPGGLARRMADADAELNRLLVDGMDQGHQWMQAGLREFLHAKPRTTTAEFTMHMVDVNPGTAQAARKPILTSTMAVNGPTTDAAPGDGWTSNGAAPAAAGPMLMSIGALDDCGDCMEMDGAPRTFSIGARTMAFQAAVVDPNAIAGLRVIRNADGPGGFELDFSNTEHRDMVQHTSFSGDKRNVVSRWSQVKSARIPIHCLIYVCFRCQERFAVAADFSAHMESRRQNPCTVGATREVRAWQLLELKLYTMLADGSFKPTTDMISPAAANATRAPPRSVAGRMLSPTPLTGPRTGRFTGAPQGGPRTFMIAGADMGANTAATEAAEAADAHAGGDDADAWPGLHGGVVPWDDTKGLDPSIKYEYFEGESGCEEDYNVSCDWSTGSCDSDGVRRPPPRLHELALRALGLGHRVVLPDGDVMHGSHFPQEVVDTLPWGGDEWARGVAMAALWCNTPLMTRYAHVCRHAGIHGEPADGPHGPAARYTEHVASQFTMAEKTECEGHVAWAVYAGLGHAAGDSPRDTDAATIGQARDWSVQWRPDADAMPWSNGYSRVLWQELHVTTHQELYLQHKPYRSHAIVFNVLALLARSTDGVAVELVSAIAIGVAMAADAVAYRKWSHVGEAATEEILGCLVREGLVSRRNRADDPAVNTRGYRVLNRYSLLVHAGGGHPTIALAPDRYQLEYMLAAASDARWRPVHSMAATADSSGSATGAALFGRGEGATLAIQGEYGIAGLHFQPDDSYDAPTTLTAGNPALGPATQIILQVAVDGGANFISKTVMVDTCSTHSVADSSYDERDSYGIDLRTAGPGGGADRFKFDTVNTIVMSAVGSNTAIEVPMTSMSGKDKLTIDLLIGHIDAHRLGAVVNFHEGVITFHHPYLSGSVPMVTRRSDEGRVAAEALVPRAVAPEGFMVDPSRPPAPGSPTLQISVGGQIVHLDAGSVVSIVSSKELACVVPNSWTETTVRLRAIDGQSIPIGGTVQLALSPDPTAPYITAIVSPGLGVEVLLGTDFLSKSRAILSYPLRTAFFPVGALQRAHPGGDLHGGFPFLEQRPTGSTSQQQADVRSAELDPSCDF